LDLMARPAAAPLGPPEPSRLGIGSRFSPEVLAFRVLRRFGQLYVLEPKFIDTFHERLEVFQLSGLQN
jgi:hypothetical protein